MNEIINNDFDVVLLYIKSTKQKVYSQINIFLFERTVMENQKLSQVMREIHLMERD